MGAARRVPGDVQPDGRQPGETGDEELHQHRRRHLPPQRRCFQNHVLPLPHTGIRARLLPRLLHCYLELMFQNEFFD